MGGLCAKCNGPTDSSSAVCGACQCPNLDVREPVAWPGELSDEGYARLRAGVELALASSCPFTCQVTVRAWKVAALFRRIDALQQEVT
jgi:hypothetical protein